MPMMPMGMPEPGMPPEAAMMAPEDEELMMEDEALPVQEAPMPEPAEMAAMMGMLIRQQAMQAHDMIDQQAQAQAIQMAQIIMETADSRAQTVDAAAMPPVVG